MEDKSNKLSVGSVFEAEASRSAVLVYNHATGELTQSAWLAGHAATFCAVNVAAEAVVQLVDWTKSADAFLEAVYEAQREDVPGGYLVVESHGRDVFHGYAKMSDGADEYLGVFERRREAVQTVLSASKRTPLSRYTDCAKKA